MQSKESPFEQNVSATKPNISYVIIVGPSGAGKSVFSQQLSDKLNTVNLNNGQSVISQVINSDSYAADYSNEDPDLIPDINFDIPSEFQWSKFESDIDSVINGNKLVIKSLNFSGHKGCPDTIIEPLRNSILIVEGIQLLNKESFVEGSSCIIHLDANSKTCISRRSARNSSNKDKNSPEFKKSQFDTTYRYIRYIQNANQKYISDPVEKLIKSGKKPVFSVKMNNFLNQDKLIDQVAEFVMQNIKSRGQDFDTDMITKSNAEIKENLTRNFESRPKAQKYVLDTEAPIEGYVGKEVARINAIDNQNKGFGVK